MCSATLGLALAITAAAAAPAGDAGLDPAQRTMLDLRVIAAVFQGYADDGRGLPDFETALATGAQVADAMGAKSGGMLRKILTASDGWGNPYHFLISSGHYRVVSYGSDGKPDLAAAALAEMADAEVESDTPERDIILLDGDLRLRPKRKRSPAAAAMAEIRQIGISIESYAVDNDVYPGPISGLRPVDVLKGDLQPIYIRSLPLLDPWGHPYLVWSDTKGYLVVTAGSDGTLDRVYLADDSTRIPLPKDIGLSAAAEADIVFSDGQFVLYPPGSQD